MANQKNIFITGITGCVGHYLYDELSKNPDYHLYLLVRNPARIRFDHTYNDHVTILEGDLEHIEVYQEQLQTMDAAIHAATDWYGEMNYEHTIRLFQFLAQGRCQKVLYFSTASILDANNLPMKEALADGHPYIQRKYQMYTKLAELPINDRLIILFPTMVFGGDATHPYSSASAGIPTILPYVKRLPVISFDASFHFIHAEDIAKITAYLLEHNGHAQSLVLGNPRVTFDQCMEVLRKVAEIGPVGQFPLFRLRVPAWLVPLLARALRIRMSSWDLFCLKKRHFVHTTVNTETFGFLSRYKTLEQILQVG